MTDDYRIDDIITANILFLGYSLDAKLCHGHWQVVGNTKLRQDIKFPFYKLGLPPDDMSITDYKGRVLRKCSFDEFNALEYKTVFAPVRYENAPKAFYKFKEWVNDDYDRILYEKAVASAEIYNSSFS